MFRSTVAIYSPGFGRPAGEGLELKPSAGDASPR